MHKDEARLHWADYVVTVLCLLVALGIGVFFALFRGGQNTKEAYLMGNRRMRLFPVALSLFISFQSAITLIGIPSDTYNTGTMVGFVFIGICIANHVAQVTMVPLLYPLRLTSVYQYLQLRHKSNIVRIIITAIGMCQQSLYMGVALYTPALVLQAVAGLSLWVSLLLVGAVGTIYTAIGGYQSVVWTDVFQTIIVFVGIFSVLIKGLILVGGFSEMGRIASDGGRLIFAEMDPKERHSTWSTLFGAIFMWMVYVFNQATLQRVCSLPSQKHAQLLFFLNTPMSLLYGGTLTLMGVIAYTYFVSTGCDPYVAGYIENKNQVAPYFVTQVLQDMPGMTGLYMSMLFCGALSTLSSGINSLAAVTVEDVLAPALRGKTDTTVTIVAKITVACFGCLSLTLAYLMRYMSGPVSQMSDSVVGAFGSPVLGVFFLSAGFPQCNVYGAVAGIVVGSGVSVMTAVGTTLYGAPTPSLPAGPTDLCDVTNSSLWNVTALTYDTTLTPVFLAENVTSARDATVHSASAFTFWDISYLWFGVLGFFSTVITGVIVSLITGWGKEKEEVDPRLIFPICRKLWGLSDPEDKEREQQSMPLNHDYEMEVMKPTSVDT